jgi:uncharacterized protein (DUF2267 family)
MRAVGDWPAAVEALKDYAASSLRRAAQHPASAVLRALRRRMPMPAD